LEEVKSIAGKPTRLVYDDYRHWCYGSGHKNIPTRTKFTRDVLAETGLITKDMRSNLEGGRVVKSYSEK